MRTTIIKKFYNIYRNGIPPRPKARRRQPRQNSNAIGGDNGNFTGNNMFNIHNGNNLAGYGYFPPVAYLAVTTYTDVTIKEPNNHLILPSVVQCHKIFMYALLIILVLMIILM